MTTPNAINDTHTASTVHLHVAGVDLAPRFCGPDCCLPEGHDGDCVPDADGGELEVVSYRHDYGTHYVAGVADLADGGAEYTVIIADGLDASYSHCCHCHVPTCEHATAALRHHERNRHLAVRHCH